jgi:predicted nucleic acid-binding protein
VTRVPTESYAQFEEEARRLIGERDPEDWPTVALALALGLPVWTQDRDFETSGLRVYSTGQLLDFLSSLDKA